MHVRFAASEGPGAHGTLHVGDRRTTVKDRKTEIGKGLFSKMLADLEIDGQEFQETVTTNLHLAKECGDMPATFNYPAEIERGEDGRCVITFPDFGWGATDGATRDEALTDARDLLRELIADTIREGEALPEPSRPGKSRPLVIPPVQIALKAALYDAYRQTGHSKRRIARDLAVTESEVRRMLNPEHATKAATIDDALRRLGKRIALTVT